MWPYICPVSTVPFAQSYNIFRGIKQRRYFILYQTFWVQSYFTKCSKKYSLNVSLPLFADESWWTANDCELKRASICSYPITAWKPQRHTTSWFVFPRTHLTISLTDIVFHWFGLPSCMYPWIKLGMLHVCFMSVLKSHKKKTRLSYLTHGSHSSFFFTPPIDEPQSVQSN